MFDILGAIWEKTEFLLVKTHKCGAHKLITVIGYIWHNGSKTQKLGKSLHYRVISISNFEKTYTILMDNKSIFEILNFFRLKMSLKVQFPPDWLKRLIEILTLHRGSSYRKWENSIYFNIDTDKTPQNALKSMIEILTS